MYIKGLGLKKEASSVSNVSDAWNEFKKGVSNYWDNWKKGAEAMAEEVKQTVRPPMTSTPTTATAATDPANDTVNPNGGQVMDSSNKDNTEPATDPGDKPKNKNNTLSRIAAWALNNPGATAGLATGALLLATDPFGMIWRQHKPGESPVNTGSLLGTGLVGGGLYAGLKYAPELFGKFKDLTTTKEDKEQVESAYKKATEGIIGTGKTTYNNALLQHIVNTKDDQDVLDYAKALANTFGKTDFDVNNLDTLVPGAEMVARLEDDKRRTAFVDLYKKELRGLDPSKVSAALRRIHNARTALQKKGR